MSNWGYLTIEAVGRVQNVVLPEIESLGEENRFESRRRKLVEYNTEEKAIDLDALTQYSKSHPEVLFLVSWGGECNEFEVVIKNGSELFFEAHDDGEECGNG